MKQRKFIELHNGRPTLKHYRLNTTLDPALLRLVIRQLGWRPEPSFEEIVKDPSLVFGSPYAKEILRVAIDFVGMIEKTHMEEEQP